MKVAVVGAGNAGVAAAADMSGRGHEVTLIKTSHSMHDENFNYLLSHNGAVEVWEDGKTRINNISHISRNLAKVADVQVVILYLMTNYHEKVISELVNYLHAGQIVIVNPGYLSTAYFLKHGVQDGVSIVEAESSFIDCRISGPGKIRVGFRNVRNPVGVYPTSKQDEVMDTISQLGFPLSPLGNVVEAALHNPNLIVHTVGAVMSIPRIEKTGGDYCMYHEVWTPSVWRILEKLDAEKMDVLETLGLKRIPYVEACKFRNTLDDERDAKEVFFWYAAMPTRAKGPLVVDSRYISEDVPQGLVMLEALGKRLDVETPVCSALISIASAALGRDLRAEGRTPDSLGIENIDAILSDCGMNII